MWFRHDYGTGPARFYWAAEASGPNAVPPSVEAFEAPTTPSRDFGLEDPTGPNISLYVLGGNHPAVVSATVVGPSGQPLPTHLKNSFDGAMLVVDNPVAERTKYDVSVVWRSYEYRGPGQGEVKRRSTQSFSFTTGFIPKELTPLLKLVNGGRAGRRVRVWIKSDQSLRGREAGVSVTHTTLAEPKTPIFVPKPTARRKLHIRVSTKQFPFEEGVVKGANANLELRWSSKRTR